MITKLLQENFVYEAEQEMASFWSTGPVAGLWSRLSKFSNIWKRPEKAGGEKRPEKIGRREAFDQNAGKDLKANDQTI